MVRVIKELMIWAWAIILKWFLCIIKYALDNRIGDIHAQTWPANIKIIELMKNCGIKECNYEESFRIVRGELYAGLTFN